MSLRILVAAVIAGMALSAGAHASSTTTTLSFSGNVNSIYDGSGLFGTAGTSYGSSTLFTGTITYDSGALPACNINNCTFTLPSAVETLTVNAHTVTFNATSGTLTFQKFAPQQITFSGLNGAGFSFSSEQFSGGTSFFGAGPSYNLSPQLGFAAITTDTYGSGQESNTSIGLHYTRLSAVTTTVAVPEPRTFAIFASGLLALGLIRRRKAR